MTDPTGEHGYDVVMPFVACHSNGGRYDDDGFVAGWACAGLDAVLRLASVAQVSSLTATVRTDLAGQLDLVAMRWGYGLVVDELSGQPGWATAVFTHHHHHDAGGLL